MNVRRSFLLLFILLLAASASAQLFKRPQPGIPADEDGAQLVKSGDESVLRYPVAHVHFGSGCAGYLYFSRDKIWYEVVRPEGEKGHSFQYARSDLSNANQWTIWGQPNEAAELKFHGGTTTYHFMRMRKRWIDGGTTKLDWANVLAYQELVEAATRFDDVMDRVRAREARLHPPATPPVISMLDPVGAESGKALDVAAARVSLRGVASHASGIASVTVNNAPAHLKALAPTTVEFTLPDFAVNPGASAIVVMASATDKSQAQMIFTMNHPDVRLLDPAPNAETDKEAVRVRGIAAGFRNIDRVEIAGKPATFHTNPAGEVEFEADAALPAIGPNTIQGFVIPHDGSRLPFKIEVQRKPPPGPPPLALSEVLEALQKGVPAPRVASLVSQFGVSFALNDDAERQLRSAGADTDLLLAIAKSKK
ncbi:MAG TPA: hypothetical protein VMS96_10795 [Terriglobales bacterium]|nr:hypothetical protein [Terriglobales bacterium]